MSMYQLTAKIEGGTNEAYLFDASSDEEATITAIGYIMDAAYAHKSGAWAKGAISLSDPDGNTIRTMNAK
jgi:hypothetical protein